MKIYLRRLLLLFSVFVISVAAGSAEDSSAAFVKKHVGFLTGIQPARNHVNLASLEKALQYLRREAGRYSTEVRIQEFKVKQWTYKNLLVNFGPAEAETIVVGAHYDVCGDQPGADDNASGSAGLLLLAKYLSENKASLRYRYELVFYTLEEPPYFRTEFMGSAIHAKSLKEKKTRVKYMLSLETIGYYSDAKGSQSYPAMLGWFYPDQGNFIAVVGRRADADLLAGIKAQFQKSSPLKIITLAAPSFVTGVDFSDHLNYWKYGWNAAMVTDTAFMRNHNYHELTDTPDTLHYEKIAQVILGIYGAITQP